MRERTGKPKETLPLSKVVVTSTRTTDPSRINCRSGWGEDGSPGAFQFPRSRPLLSSLQPAAQRFGDAPRLGNAAARRVVALGIEDLAELPNARLAQVRHQPVEQVPCPDVVVGIQLQINVNKWADQPRPHSPLVVGGITGAQVAVIARLVVGMPRG